MSSNNHLAIALRLQNEANKVLGEFKRDLQSVEDQGNKTGRAVAAAGAMVDRAGGQFAKASAGVGRFAGFLKTTAAVASGFVLGQGLMRLPGLISGLGDLGATMELNLSKANRVFGENIAVVQEWAGANAASMGLSKNQVLGLASGLQDLLVPMGFSRDLATDMTTKTLGLAGALAEWSGGQKTAAEVAEILTSAYLGETDGLKALGIAISAADVQARLAAKGQSELTGKAMEQAQALAIQELIFSKSTDAQNAWAEGADSAARKQALLRARIQELREQMANKLAPVMLQLYSVALPALSVGIDLASRAATRLRPHIEAAARAVAERLPGAITLVISVLAQFLGMVTATIRGVSAGFAALVTGVTASMRAIATVVETVGRAVYTALQWLNPFAPHSPPLVDQVRDGVARIRSEFETLNAVSNELGGAEGAVRAFEDAMAGTAATLDSSRLAEKLDLIRRTGGDQAVASYQAAGQALGELRTKYNALGVELTATKAKHDAMAKSLEIERSKLDLLNDALAAAKQRFSDLAGTPLLEQKSFDDAQKKIDRAVTELQLKIVKLKQGGPLEVVDGEGNTQLTAAGREVEKLEREIEKLRLKAEESELSEKLAIDPLKDKLDSLTAVAPQPFDAIYDGMRKAEAEAASLAGQITKQEAVIGGLQGEYDALNVILADQTKLYEDLGGRIDAQASSMERYLELAKEAVQAEEAQLAQLQAGAAAVELAPWATRRPALLRRSRKRRARSKSCKTA